MTFYVTSEMWLESTVDRSLSFSSPSLPHKHIQLQPMPAKRPHVGCISYVHIVPIQVLLWCTSKTLFLWPYFFFKVVFSLLLMPIKEKKKTPRLTIKPLQKIYTSINIYLKKLLKRREKRFFSPFSPINFFHTFFGLFYAVKNNVFYVNIRNPQLKQKHPKSWIMMITTLPTFCS